MPNAGKINQTAKTLKNNKPLIKENFKSLSKFDVLTFGESEIKSRGGVSFTPKRSKSKHLFFKGTYLERADKNIWRKNGMASYFSHMAPRTVKVCVF